MTPKPDFVAEMQWRGMLHDITPGTREQLQKEMTAGYIGFDPTASSLHVGSLAPIMILRHFQRAGHKPIALVGGATGMVGDPSGKSKERNMLSEETLQDNLAGIRKQLTHFLDFDCGENSAEIVNNYDWFKDMDILAFLREVGKHITVNYMMAKDSVKNRISGEDREGISFTEFTYQLIQGYDYYWLHQNKKCKIQMGGSDQWGNILTGTELIRRKSGGGEAFALTTPLITKDDGSKFGKTEGGNVWLDPERTSPYQFYQFWLNVSDLDAAKYIRIFTFLSQQDIESLEIEHAQTPHLRMLQKKLAEQVTDLVHGAVALEQAICASQVLFGECTPETLASLNETDLLDVFAGVPTANIAHNELANGIDLVSFLSEKTQIFPSKGEARKAVGANSIGLNKQKMINPQDIIDTSFLLHNKYVVVQRGKKNYYLVVCNER